MTLSLKLVYADNYFLLPTKTKQSVASLRNRGDDNHESWIAPALRIYPRETELFYCETYDGEIVATIVITKINKRNLVSIYTKNKYRNKGIMSSMISNRVVTKTITSKKNLVAHKSCIDFLNKHKIKNVEESELFPRWCY